MKNVLLLIHDDVGEEARMQAALDIVRVISGHLTCLDIVQIPPLIGTDYMMADAEMAVLVDVQQREAENRRRVRERLADEDVAWDWVDATGGIAPLLEAQSGLADLIVLNTAFADHESPDMRATVAEVVLRARKPILAVPAAARGVRVKDHALIAWDGSAAVAAAVHAVVPLLAFAGSVTIIQVGTPGAVTVDEAAAYLSRHGIHARIEYRDGPQDGIADGLLDLCKDRGPSYCVMGAYSHSRMHECLFGGVTRRMLAESPVPLILGH